MNHVIGQKYVQISATVKSLIWEESQYDKHRVCHTTGSLIWYSIFPTEDGWELEIMTVDQASSGKPIVKPYKKLQSAKAYAEKHWLKQVEKLFV